MASADGCVFMEIPLCKFKPFLFVQQQRMLQELWDLIRLKLFSQVFILGFIPLLSVVSALP